MIERIRQHAWMKVWFGGLLVVVFVVVYGGTQRLSVRPEVTLWPTAVDRWIAFSPGWFAVYFMLYPLTAAAWLATERSQIVRYGAGLMLILAVAAICFVLWPIAGPRPAGPPQQWWLEMFYRVDLPGNTLPSLHVSFAVYHARLIERLVKVPTPGRVALWVLVGLISYSTMATKQHWFLDVPAGAMLGFVGDRLAWRKR